MTPTEKKLRDALIEVADCFSAAYIEGLSDALGETNDERLKDLIVRRVLFAHEAATRALDDLATTAEGNAPDGHNFDLCTYFDNWLSSAGLLLTPHTEDIDGAMAPAMNWIASVRTALAAAQPVHAGEMPSRGDAVPVALERAAQICDGLANLYTEDDLSYDTGYTAAARRAAKEIRELIPSPTPAPVTGEKVASDLQPLLKFYAVDSLEELARIQDRHISRLQAKLPSTDQPAFTRVREG